MGICLTALYDENRYVANFYCCKSSNFVYGVLYLKGFVYVDIESVLHSLDKRAYEQFIEHLDRCIYGNIWG